MNTKHWTNTTKTPNVSNPGSCSILLHHTPLHYFAHNDGKHHGSRRTTTASSSSEPRSRARWPDMLDLLTLTAEPLLTPCDHIFCRTCIHQALSNQSICPIDRRPCTHGQLRRMDGLSLRIWSGIQVKCGCHDIGCAWRGSIADYSAHLQNCTVRSSRNSSAGRNNSNNSAMEEELESLREDNASLQTQVNEALRQNEILRQTVISASDSAAQLISERDSLKQQRDSLQESLNRRPDVPRLFYGSYCYTRENVVQLSQLISRYLENKPREIDRNQIYDCVRNCYNDLERGWEDNPEHYFMDMRMLLATCLASTWFSDNQRKSLRNWYDNQFNSSPCPICG